MEFVHVVKREDAITGYSLVGQLPDGLTLRYLQVGSVFGLIGLGLMPVGTRLYEIPLQYLALGYFCKVWGFASICLIGYASATRSRTLLQMAVGNAAILAPLTILASQQITTDSYACRRCVSANNDPCAPFQGVCQAGHGIYMTGAVLAIIANFVMVVTLVLRRDSLSPAPSSSTYPAPLTSYTPPQSFKPAPAPVASSYGFPAPPPQIQQSYSASRGEGLAPLAPGGAFQSGLWSGFYEYGNGQKDEMQLELNMSGGKIRSDGTDPVGRFEINGEYDANSREVRFEKRYIGKHSVEYHGFSDGVRIIGEWEIKNQRGTPLRGKFEIWHSSNNYQSLAQSFRPAYTVGY
eukprot:tig00020554_g10884.t1